MLFWQFGFYAYAVLFMSKLTGHRSEWIEPPLVHSRQEKECFHSAPTCCWNNKQLAYYSTGEGSSNENVPSGLPQPPGPQILARNADESTRTIPPFGWVIANSSMRTPKKWPEETPSSLASRVRRRRGVRFLTVVPRGSFQRTSTHGTVTPSVHDDGISRFRGDPVQGSLRSSRVPTVFLKVSSKQGS